MPLAADELQQRQAGQMGQMIIADNCAGRLEPDLAQAA